MFDATEESPLPTGSCVIIYEMTIAADDGLPWVYIGKREGGSGGWSLPQTGTGRIPHGRRGYSGSGKRWKTIVAKYGEEAIRWTIVERVGPEDWVAAEQDAVEAGRTVWGNRCVNLLDGGDGFTSEDAKRLYEDPKFRAKMAEARRRQAEARRRQAEDPEWRAKMAEAMRKKFEDPKVRAKIAAGVQRKYDEDPEWRAKIAEAVRNKSGIAPLDGIITVLATRNPHQPGGRGKHLAFSLYRDGMTVAEFFEVARPHGLMEPRNPDRKSSRALASTFLRRDIKAGHIRIDRPAATGSASSPEFQSASSQGIQ